MARVHLVVWNNAAGLSRDLAVLTRALADAGHDLTVNDPQHPGRLRRLWERLRAGGLPWDLTLFLERVVPGWMTLSTRNVLVPNPEWLDESPHLQRLDGLWCKTRSAVQALDGLGVPSLETGFTTPDRRLALTGTRPAIDWRTALHIAGDNPTKGTRRLVEVWGRHPEWPRLTVVLRGRRVGLPPALPPNVSVVNRFVPDPELAELQARCGLHFCLSEVEGFGHTLLEALSLGVVAVTTDAPPMNEIVTADRGVLVAATPFAPMRRGYRYRFDPAALERTVDQLLGTDPEALAALGSAGRAWFEANDLAFRQRLAAVVETTLNGTPEAAGRRPK